ncbi:hypothetical protein GM3709_218 [Geminocystis sp. NIES-3709]|nr:hypothetical protein GM3709_218 [Geminocystis sp. NIES-3709]
MGKRVLLVQSLEILFLHGLDIFGNFNQYLIYVPQNFSGTFCLSRSKTFVIILTKI